MAQQLLFKNPVLREGLNVTVRNGTKWLGQASPGDELDVYETGTEDDPSKKIATVTHMANKRIDLDQETIPAIWLAMEHDPECRQMGGLIAAMDRAYGEGQWGPKLTVVFFWVGDLPS